jgi:hypothetical protein
MSGQGEVGWDSAAMGWFIAQAGNTVVPAVLAVESLGYEVVVDGAGVRARRGDESYLAEDAVALLGLIRLVELRSWEWRANEDEIHETLRRFGWERRTVIGMTARNAA